MDEHVVGLGQPLSTVFCVFFVPFSLVLTRR